MKILQANQKYRQVRGRPDTSVVIREPSVGGGGFSALIEENIGGREGSFELRAEAGGEVNVNKDAAALVVAALILDKYKSVSFDFDVGINTLEEIKVLTKAAEVTARGVREDIARRAGTGRALNYSGGIDSSALRSMCPELTLMSVDFAGPDNPWEEAGREMFGRTNSKIARTNAHEFLFPHFPIGYYNLASLLYADSLGIRYAADGRIMTDTLRDMEFLEGLQPSPLDMPDEVYGARVLYPLLGLTKAGTQMIAARLAPDVYEKTVQISIGGVKNKARGRLLMDECITGGSGLDILDGAGPPPAYGGNPPRDFYAFYFINRLGAKKTSAFVNEIPESVTALAESLSLDFYEKYDQKALEYLPEDFAAYFREKLENAGVEFYSESDYAERAAVTEALREKPAAGEGG